MFNIPEKMKFIMDLINTLYYKNNPELYKTLDLKQIQVDYPENICSDKIALLIKSKKFTNFLNNFDLKYYNLQLKES